MQKKQGDSIEQKMSNAQQKRMPDKVALVEERAKNPMFRQL